MKAVTKYDVMKIMIVCELQKLKDEGLLEDFIEYYKKRRKEFKKTNSN